MVEYPSIKDIQHPLECGTPSEMLHYGLEYHCAEYDVLVQKCTKNIISHYTICNKHSTACHHAFILAKKVVDTDDRLHVYTR